MNPIATLAIWLALFMAGDGEAPLLSYDVTIQNRLVHGDMRRTTIEYSNGAWKFSYGVVVNGGSAAYGGCSSPLPAKVTLRWETDGGVPVTKEVTIAERTRELFRPERQNVIFVVSSPTDVKLEFQPKSPRQE